MRIAVFHNLPDGGAKIALFEQLKRLKAKHHLDLFLLSPEKGEYSLLPFCQNYYLYPYDSWETNRKKGIYRVIGDLKTFTVLKILHLFIAAKIDKGKYDLAFIHQSRLTHAPYLLSFLKTKSVYYCQEPLRMVYEKHLEFKSSVSKLKKLYESTNRCLRKKIDFQNIKNASHIFVASKYIQNYVKKVYSRSSVLTPMGVDTDFYKPVLSSKRNGILYIGSQNQTDGYQLLKKALNNIPSSLKPRLTQLSFQRGKFIHTGKEVVKAYAQVKLTVCPAKQEPFGLTALESMSCGVPVVAVNEGGYKETVKNGITGFLSAENPVDLAKKITLLLKNEQLRIRMSTAARKHVLQHWSWDKYIKILEKELEKTQL